MSKFGLWLTQVYSSFCCLKWADQHLVRQVLAIVLASIVFWNVPLGAIAHEMGTAPMQMGSGHAHGMPGVKEVAPDRPPLKEVIPVSNRPDPAEALLNRGIDAAQRGRYPNAIKLFSKTLELDPENDEAYWQRGTARYQIGEYGAAVQDFTDALDRNPYYTHLYRSRGEAKLKLGDLLGALADFTHAVEQYPEASISYWIRGSLYARLGELEKALKDLDQAIRLNPNHSLSYAQRGLIYAEQGQVDAAAENYQMAVKLLDPENWTSRDLLISKH
jgi:tetratricopeptide (TPR) repeat protein